MAAPDDDTALHGLIRYAAPLGFCEKTVRVVYEAVLAEAEIKRTERIAEVRRRLLAAAKTIL